MISKRQWLETNNSEPEKILWEKRDWVRITKLSEHPEAKVPACPQEEFTPGQPHMLSLPVEYWVEGYLLKAPEIGAPLRLDRRIRNGVCLPGYFHTSVIQEITENRIATMNSIYLIEAKSPPPSEGFNLRKESEKD